MKSAALGLGVLAASGSIALAGGEAIQPGGVRHPGTAVPVPAPVPIPDVATGWYIRIDAAYSQGNVSKYRSSDPLVDQIRGDSYLDNFPRYGLGFGYQFNRWLRADITIDQRNDVESRGKGQRNYTIDNPTGATSTVIRMRDTYSDAFTSSNSTALINAYVDMPVHHAFTPYIGAGIGFVRHQLKGRNFSMASVCVDDNDCDPTQAGDQTASVVDRTRLTGAGGVDYAIATALMAGFSYKVWDNWKIDLGYRWLHLGGTSWAGRSSTTPAEMLKLPDQSIHELRAGLRIDIN